MVVATPPPRTGRIPLKGLIPLRIENNQRFLRQNRVIVFDLKFPLTWNDLPGFVESKA
jgi:hypothetical protein